MMSSKTGNWFVDNPQRARSNNSVVLLRDELTLESLEEMIEFIKQFGEPGFILTDNLEHTYNPCVEIGMLPVADDGATGFQACNLTEINGALCDTEERFYEACKAGAIIGTLQAGYTNFNYLSDATRKIVEREALIGVSVTGWMNSPQVLFKEDVMRKGAEIVKEYNGIVADMLGINHAARTTCVKPAGNTSILLQTANGIHGEHSQTYFRHVQMNKETEVAKLLIAKFPSMIEDSVWSRTGTDICIAFPFIAGKKSRFKDQLLGVKQLEYVKLAQQNWVEFGTNVHLCTDPKLRHNVSNTITVEDWDSVIKYVHENKKWFAGISFIPMTGDKDYAQAPNAAVYDEKELIRKYGAAALFASGLICHGVDSFVDLWLAISTANGMGLDITEDNHENSTKRDFVRRFTKFASTYFNGDMRKCSDCLKDVYYLHKWEKIQIDMEDLDVDWIAELGQKQYTDIDTMGAAGCSGAKGCEI
jgi:ribonucleoside-triphosphate reductase (thioredoxin)